jgi:hypothetical protein
VSDEQPPTGGGAGTPDQLKHAKDLQAARAAESTVVQASATKWQAGTAALLALVTGAVGVGLRDTLTPLEPAFSVAVGVLMLAALASSITAALLGLYSAIGLPKLAKTATPVDPEEGHARAKAEWRTLRTSIALTVFALVVFVVAMALTWWAPSQPAGDLARVSDTANTVCGHADVNGSELIVTTSNGAVHIVQMAEITSWKLVSSCP